MNLMNDYEIDDSESIVSTKKSGIIEKLKANDLLRYGSIISDNDVEIVMDLKKYQAQGNEWDFCKLQLREIIKSEGYYVSSRGRDNSLYILLPNEMPLHNEKKNKSAFRNLKQRTRGLHMIDHSLLSSENQKKLEFEIFRNASFEIEMNKKLKERCRY